jgi:DedD protein
MSDDGLHEIQLNGKQLVFMFMAVTVVAVVIFLCGVMVGRGVRAPRPVESIDAATTIPTDPTAPTERLAPAPATTTPAGALPSSQETLTYPDRLEDATPPPETLEEPTPEPPAGRQAAPPPPVSAPEAPSRSEVASPEPPGNGFVVQVAATRERGEADTIARRLASKGYPSFVTTPGAGAARVFRVRVGKYGNRREAETVANRLQKEEQFKPWITR